MAIALTKSQPIRQNASRIEVYRAIFDPIVKPEMKKSWDDQFEQWFVVTDSIEESLVPGKLKGELKPWLPSIQHKF